MITNGLFNFWQINLRLRIKLYFYLLTKPKYIKEIFKLIKQFHPEKIFIPTLICVSEKDTHISPKQSIDFYNRLNTDKTLLIIPGVDHDNAKLTDILDSFKTVLMWLSKQLKIPVPKIQYDNNYQSN